MKKAKQVDFPQDRPLTFEEYNDLSKHAYNSALWYVTNYNKNSYQIRTKLYDKGYLKDEVPVVKNDEKTYHNIVEETITKLKDFSYINDESYVESAIYSGLRKGKSISSIRTKLFQTGLPKDLIDKGMEEFSEETQTEMEDDALDKAASKIVNSYSFTKITDPFKAKQKIVQSLATKGFPMGKIFEWIDENLDLE